MEQVKSPAANPLGSEKISRLILKFSIPAIISMLVNAVYNIVDQIYIGRSELGMLGIAATNIAFPLVTLSTAVALLFGIGGASNFSLMLGRKEKKKAAVNMGNAFSLMTIAGVILGLLTILFLNPLIMLFGATNQIAPLASSYTFIIAFGIPFMVFTTGACHIIRADGSPFYSMFCMVAGALFNIIFDPIFLYVFDMGLDGIALATILGQILTAVIALFYLLRKVKCVTLAKEDFKIKLKYIKEICLLGMAACFNQLAMTVVQIVLNNTLRHYGGLSQYGSEIPLASVGAISKINILFMGFTVGIAQGCQPINGFNYGARNFDRVKETCRLAIISSTVISVIAFLIFQLFPLGVVSVFGEGSELYYQFAIRYLRIFMFMTFVNGVQPVAANFFTAIGKSSLGIFMSLTRQVIFLLPLIVLLPLFFGIEGVLYAGPVADGAAAVLAFLFLRREMAAMK